MYSFMEDLETCDPELYDAMLYMEACEIATQRANIKADATCKLQELQMRSCMVKAENDGLDFNQLYEESASDITEKIIAGIKAAWAKIKAIFKSLLSKIFAKGNINKIPDSAILELNWRFKKVPFEIKSVARTCKSAVSNYRSANGVLTAAHKISALVKNLNACATNSDAKTVKITGNEVKKILKDVEMTADEMYKLTDRMSKAEIESKRSMIQTRVERGYYISDDMVVTTTHTTHYTDPNYTVKDAFTQLRNEISEIPGAVSAFVSYALRNAQVGTVSGESWEDTIYGDDATFTEEESFESDGYDAFSEDYAYDVDALLGF